ncbi:hypothetical protein STEG23_020967, partial [Scotinomys teguina]
IVFKRFQLEDKLDHMLFELSIRVQEEADSSTKLPLSSKGSFVLSRAQQGEDEKLTQVPILFPDAVVWEMVRYDI